MLNERGMALLITVMVVSLLSAITLHFGLMVRQEIIASTHGKNRTYLETMAMSGVHLGLAALEKDGTENDYDSGHDRWAQLATSNLAGLFGGGELKVEFFDLGGRLQINSLPENEKTQEMLMRLLEMEPYFDLDEDQAREVVHALIDWIDQDDRESDYGAEDSYYYGLNPSYGTRNMPVEHLDELLMVKGMTQELLFGGGNDKGLSQYLTVKGTDGKININMVSAQLLLAMSPDMTAELAEKMIAFRKDPANVDMLDDPSWYKKIPSWPGDVDIDQELLTIKSTFFQITATGEYHSLKKSVEVVVERDENNEIILLSKKVN